jgi:hypothetical protein
VGKIRSGSAPFKNYRELARRLRHDGRLVLPRPERCVRCGRDCGFVKDGHYSRDFVFTHNGLPSSPVRTMDNTNVLKT